MSPLLVVMSLTASSLFVVRFSSHAVEWFGRGSIPSMNPSMLEADLIVPPTMNVSLYIETAFASDGLLVLNVAVNSMFWLGDTIRM